jgi:hypothetical protein
VLANLVDGADIGMIQRRCGAGFPAEAFERLGVLGRILGQKLQSHQPAKFRVLSLVDHTHAAAQLFDDTVMRDGLADQSRARPI